MEIYDLSELRMMAAFKCCNMEKVYGIYWALTAFFFIESKCFFVSKDMKCFCTYASISPPPPPTTTTTTTTTTTISFFFWITNLVFLFLGNDHCRISNL